jgi:hypothetical protein
MPHFATPSIFNNVLADIPPTVTDALLAAWRDPSPDTVDRAELAVALHLDGPYVGSPEAALLWAMLERVAGRDVGQHLLHRLAEVHA